MIPGYSLRASKYSNAILSKGVPFGVVSCMVLRNVSEVIGLLHGASERVRGHKSPAWCIKTRSSSIVAILVCAVLSGVNSCYGLLL